MLIETNTLLENSEQGGGGERNNIVLWRPPPRSMRVAPSLGLVSAEAVMTFLRDPPSTSASLWL